jgi:hypothetical protein
MDKKDCNQKNFFNSLRGERSKKADDLHRLLRQKGLILPLVFHVGCYVKLLVI